MQYSLSTAYIQAKYIEAKYLGLYIRSGQKFTCNFDKQKSKFYRSANCIFAKLENLNPQVTIHLVHSIALPTLTYAIEALPLTKTQIISLEHPWSCMLMKVGYLKRLINPLFINVNISLTFCQFVAYILYEGLS